ncbi:MAG: hypothetical protein D6725_12765 [Planctomycetota bacterium]|nr:MAG: hypothetical protein D6725_12765 [Planctomycetota bacterium]
MRVVPRKTRRVRQKPLQSQAGCLSAWRARENETVNGVRRFSTRVARLGGELHGRDDADGPLRAGSVAMIGSRRTGLGRVLAFVVFEGICMTEGTFEHTGGSVRSAVRRWLVGGVVVLAAAFSLVAVERIRRWVPPLESNALYRVATDAIECTPPPRWVPTSLREQVLSRAGFPTELSLLDADLNARLAAAFAAHPWVRRVVRVQKTVPARIVVELEYREPLACVRDRRGRWLPIDRDGVLLPVEDLPVSFLAELPKVVGLEELPPPDRVGVVWSTAQVGAAVSLLERLRGDWERFELQAIECLSGSAPDDPQFALITQGGSRILWGHAGESGHPQEPPSEEKVAKLEQYLKKFGGFDGPAGAYEIDVRRPQEIVRRPLGDRGALWRR